MSIGKIGSELNEPQFDLRIHDRRRAQASGFDRAPKGFWMRVIVAHPWQ